MSCVIFRDSAEFSGRCQKISLVLQESKKKRKKHANACFWAGVTAKSRAKSIVTTLSDEEAFTGLTHSDKLLWLGSFLGRCYQGM